MFADACEKMMKCTRPVISSTCTIGGDISSSVGSFVVVNPDGWVLTAAHVIAPYYTYRDDLQKISDIDHFNEENPSNPRPYQSDWLKAHSFWWSWDGVAHNDIKISPELDLAAVKLVNFKRDSVKEYPIFTDPSKLRTGTSICRLGFPFVNVTSTFDHNTHTFTLGNEMLPIPFFPNDGIITRVINNGRTSNGAFDRMFLETSTPGLRGQSGGPIFDKHGHIIGIQSRTMHLDLGYNIKSADGKIVEHQYLNVGVATHIKSVIEFLDYYDIKYKSESDDDGYRIND